jgi:hypothetical protein
LDRDQFKSFALALSSSGTGFEAGLKVFSDDRSDIKSLFLLYCNREESKQGVQGKNSVKCKHVIETKKYPILSLQLMFSQKKTKEMTSGGADYSSV